MKGRKNTLCFFIGGVDEEVVAVVDEALADKVVVDYGTQFLILSIWQPYVVDMWFTLDFVNLQN